MQAKITPARAVAVKFAREYLHMTPWQQRLFLGDDFQRRIDALAVFVAAYDYAVALRAVPIALPAASAPVALLAVPCADDVLADVAPSLEFVCAMRFAYSQVDVDSLDPMDAADVATELDWCDYWYAWHARQLDS